MNSNRFSSLSRWLDVEVQIENDPINTISSNICYSDIYGDSDYKFVIGDIGMRPNSNSKLKVYRGTTNTMDIVLPQMPSSVVSFYTSDTTPRNAPALGIALGSYIYIYRNMKLFYKFSLPQMNILPLELDIWNKISGNHNDNDVKLLVDGLKTLPYTDLTSHSQHILTLPAECYKSFIERVEMPILKVSVVTCLATLNLVSVDRFAIACLVVGLENGDIYILDSQTFNVSFQARTHSSKVAPSRIVTSGLYNVEFRIVIATRENMICLLRRKWLEGKCLIQTLHPITDMIMLPGDDSIVVACMDKTVQCFTKKGKKLWEIRMEQTVLNIILMPLLHLSLNLIGIALKSGQIMFYNGNNFLDSLYVKGAVSAMRFGQLGQEEHVLTIVLCDGTLVIKILKRTAEFNVNALSNISQAVVLQEKPLVIPKKSKLFLELVARERDNAQAIYNAFQRDLLQLKVMALKTLVQIHQSSENSVGSGVLEYLNLTIEVDGLGPMFKILLGIRNISSTEIISKISIFFNADSSVYKIAIPLIKVPLLPPGVCYQFFTRVEELFPTKEEIVNPEIFFRNVTGKTSERSIIKALVLMEGQCRPILSATIQMPPTDPVFLPYDQLNMEGII